MTAPTSSELNARLDLPRPPGLARQWMRENPHRMDGIFAGLYLLGSIGLGVLGAYIPPDGEGALGWFVPEYVRLPQVLLLVLITVVACVALFTRRRYPLGSLIAVLAVSVFAPGDMVPAALTTIVVVILLYTVPVYRSTQAAWLGYGIAVVSALLPVPFMHNVVVADGDGLAEHITAAGISALLLLVPVMLGINAGNRQRYTEAIIDRAHQLARERDQLARLAVAEERTRIAREIHDVVGHSVSVMVTLSEGAAQVIDLAPDDAKAAIRQSAETGRAALAEMRRLIGVLRDDDDTLQAADLAPAAGLDDVPELIQGFRAAGLTVQLSFTGGASSDRGHELAIYRTVQEALTNTLRHAGPGASARVRMELGCADRGATVVDIEDDGGVPGRAAPMDGLGSGHGLLGLAERLRVFGGTLQYGPTSSGGWRVTATLPGSREGESDE